jgi:phenylacetate-CoA ligase
MYTSKIYTKSPQFLQTIILSARNYIRMLIRSTKFTQQKCEELTTHEKDINLLNTYQASQLKEVLEQASKKVPFYQNIPLVDSGNLSSFPIIAKFDILAQPEAFYDSTIKGLQIEGSTSGTTGTPLSIPQNWKSVITEQAFISRSLQWAGYQKGDKRAWIRGDMIVPMEQKKAPYWRYSYFEDMILLSSFHMINTALPMYLDAMIDYGVDIIQAYPSSILTLAKYLEANDLFYQGKLKSIVTSSESLPIADKELIEKRFKCKVFDWYGLFERVAAIASCEHDRYHILTDYSNVELVPAGTVNGKNRAEIVGTNFNNKLYPLIRYKTGDYVVLSNEKQCPCGRVYPIIESLEGREGDYLIGEDNQRISSATLSLVFKGVYGIIISQFLQESRSVITVLAVVEASVFNEAQKQRLIINIQMQLGKSIEINFSIVDSIPKTKNGKTQQIICTLD